MTIAPNDRRAQKGPTLNTDHDKTACDHADIEIQSRLDSVLHGGLREVEVG